MTDDPAKHSKRLDRVNAEVRHTIDANAMVLVVDGSKLGSGFSVHVAASTHVEVAKQLRTLATALRSIASDFEGQAQRLDKLSS